MLDHRTCSLAIVLLAIEPPSPAQALVQVVEFSGEIAGMAGERFEGMIEIALPLASDTVFGDEVLFALPTSTTFVAHGVPFSDPTFGIFVIFRDPGGDLLRFVTNLSSPSFPADFLQFFLDFSDPTGTVLGARPEDLVPFPPLGVWDEVRLSASLNSGGFPVDGVVDRLTSRLVPEPALPVLLGIAAFLVRASPIHRSRGLRSESGAQGTGTGRRRI